MPTFKLTIAYDGTGLVGWQRQASGTSVQGLLEDALAELDGKPVAVTGAGRTDAGVHAVGQVAGVSLDRTIDGESLLRAMNAKLPVAVRVTAAVEMPATFHARFHARSKTYHYRIWNGDVLNPFERPYVWHVPAPVLNVGVMSAAAHLLEGRHDFAAFQAAGTETHGTERVVLASRIVTAEREAVGPHALGRLTPQCRDELMVYEITGTGFLRYMVRAIIGTLVEIGRGKRPAEWIADVLASRERARAGPTAPAEGLFLMSVDYE
jgi:tRNA pseudouridine38-40 synthase